MTPSLTPPAYVSKGRDVTFDIIPPDGRYQGMTRLKLEGQRAISCMGVGPEVEQAIKDRLRELDDVPGVGEEGAAGRA